MKKLNLFLFTLSIVVSNLYTFSQTQNIQQAAIIDSSANAIQFGRQSLVCDNSGTYHMFYTIQSLTTDYIFKRSSTDGGVTWSDKDTVSTHEHSSAYVRYHAYTPSVSIDNNNIFHVMYEYRGAPIYSSSWAAYPPSHMNYVTNETGEWVTQVDVVNDNAIQESQGNGSTVCYLNYNQIITYNNKQHYIGYDYAWYATKYNVVFSNNIDGAWLQGDILRSYDYGVYDNVMLNATTMFTDNDSLFAVWYQRADCTVEMKSFSGDDWSDLTTIYQDSIFPTPNPTSYVTRVGSYYNANVAKIAMMRSPNENYNELLLISKANNQAWSVDTISLDDSFNNIEVSMQNDTTFIFLNYSFNDANHSSYLLKHTDSQGFISNDLLETNSSGDIVSLLSTSNTSLNPITYRTYGDDKYYIKSGILTDIASSISDTPNNISGYHLYQNRPNPVSDQTIISYTIPKTGIVRIDILNSTGDIISTIVNNRKTTGKHSTQFHTNNLSDGIYYIRMKSNGFYQTRKMIIIK